SGVSRLDSVLAVRRGEGSADSPLEQRVFRVLRPRVPPFVTHYPLTLDGVTLILDLALVDFRIAGEVEGRDVRVRSRSAFDRGKTKANLLVAHGWGPVYFTATMDDETIVRQVTALLPTDLRYARPRYSGWRPVKTFTTLERTMSSFLRSYLTVAIFP